MRFGHGERHRWLLRDQTARSADIEKCIEGVQKSQQHENAAAKIEKKSCDTHHLGFNSVDRLVMA